MIITTPTEGYSDRDNSNIGDDIIYNRDEDIKVLDNILLDAAISSTSLDIIVLINKKGKDK